MQMSASTGFRSTTTRGCTRPRSPACTRWQAAETSSTPPGIKGFGLVDIEPGEVFRYFPEFMRHSPDCQYYNCTHTHEPGCAVTAAVERGDIAPQRYISYIKLLDEDGKYRQ